MKKSKPFYILGVLLICIIFIVGAFFLFSGFMTEKREQLEKKMMQSLVNSVDWENFPWDNIPKDFPWSDMPWDNMPEDFDWNSVPWDDLPDDFPWDKIPVDQLPDDFDWNNMPWADMPEDFDWNNVPWDNMPEDFDWNNVPWDNLPEDFDWNNVPLDNMPEDFDWNSIPWDNLPEDFPYDKIPSQDLPEDFDWNNFQWDNLPEDFDWNSVPWEDMPEDFDWSRLPWENLPPDFPWERVPWNNLPPDFDWSRLPWENLPPAALLLLPWLLINPDMVPDGVLPDGFYPDAWSCEHEYISDEWYIDPYPTCVSAGERHNFCKKCKRQITEEVPATGIHNFNGDNICSVCNIRRLVILSDTLSKEYDGKPLSVPSAHVVNEMSALLSGHSVNFGSAVFASSARLGKVPNAFMFVGAAVLNGAADVSAYYFIVKQYGTLEITTRSATICTRDRTKGYDGSVLTGQPEDAYAIGLADGDGIDPASLVFGEGITEIGFCPNEIKAFTIRNANGDDVTSCYSFKTQYGRLRVTRPVAAASLSPLNNIIAENIKSALKYAGYACVSAGLNSAEKI